MFGFSSFSSLPFSTLVLTITPTPPFHKKGGDDAWTPEERKRYKALQKKLRIAEEKRIETLKTDAENPIISCRISRLCQLATP